MITLTISTITKLSTAATWQLDTQVTEEEAANDALACKNYALYDLDHQTKKANISVMEDIMVYTPVQRGVGFYLPFAGLMKTHCEFKNKSTHATIFTQRYDNLSVQDNFLNRKGVFAALKQDKTVKTPTIENWLDLVDKNRNKRAASLVNKRH